MRLIIAGGRDYQLTEQDIQKLNEIPNVMTVLSGCASGADECGERWAAEKGIPVVQFPALWAMYGKKAGPLRNKDMAKDADALGTLAAIYYDEEKFDKALRTYEILIDLCATQKEIDEFDVTLKFALSAMELKRFNEAFKALMICRGMKQDVFEVDYNLGILLFRQKSYEKAAALLLKARKLKPEHYLCTRYLGHSLFRIKRIKEAALLLRKTIDIEPDDKESLFVLAQSYSALGQQEQSLRIFTHLRTDPVMGPNAALFAGKINVKLNKEDEAIMDFEIGLRHEALSKDIRTDLQYNLAITYLKKQDLGKALGLLKELNSKVKGYKDVPILISKYD